MVSTVLAVQGREGLAVAERVPLPAKGRSKKEPPILGETGRCTSRFNATFKSEGWLPGVVARVLLVEELCMELPLFNDTPVPGGVRVPV